MAKKVSAKNTGATRKSALPSKPLAKTPPRPWPILRFVQWLVGLAVTALGIVGGVYGIWGPFWPTEPSFAPASPSSGVPLDVPFTVTNNSSLFPITDLEIECHLISVRILPHNNIGETILRTRSVNRLSPRENRSYTCPFSQSIGGNAIDYTKMVEATIQFVSIYDSSWGGRTKSFSPKFTLNSRTNPPQWVSGVPMQ